MVDDVNYYHLADHSAESIEELFDYIDQNFEQGIDVLINHWPSLPLPSLISEGRNSEDFAKRLTGIASSLYSYGQVTARRMRKHNKKGVIVNLTTNQELGQFDGLENVSAMITGLTQSWAKELTQFNIRVGAVIPMCYHLSKTDYGRWAQVQDELIRNTEYIVANDYFNGRVMAAEA